MKAVRRFKRKLRALKAQKVGLLRELIAAQGRYNRLAVREHAKGEKK